MTDSDLERERNMRERKGGKSLRKLLLCVLMLSVFSFARIQPPQKVKVQLEQYAIIVTSHMEFPGQKGWTDNPTRVILVQAGQNLCDEQDTIAHELMHAIIKTEHSGDMNTVHEFIYSVATPLIDLMRDNPELVRYFLQSRLPCRSTGR